MKKAFQVFNETAPIEWGNLNFLEEVADDSTPEEVQTILPDGFSGMVIILEEKDVPVDTRQRFVSNTGFPGVDPGKLR